MKMQVNHKLVLKKQYLFTLLLILSLIIGCDQWTFDKREKVISERCRKDIDYLIFVSRKWTSLNWKGYTNYEDLFRLKNSDIHLAVVDIYYNSDSTKFVALMLEKIPNVKYRYEFNSRICPAGNDIIYGIKPLIGFRKANNMLDVYPLEVRCYSCFSDSLECVKVARKFYESEFADKEMGRIYQSGKEKGKLFYQRFEYNVKDPNFWEKCWIWEKDMVGSKGLCFFQIDAYLIDFLTQTCNDCAEELKVPNFEDEYLKLKDSINVK
jgi:hypothetical protein